MTVPPKSVIDESSLGRMTQLARKSPPGRFCEVGVYKGGSAWPLAALARERGVSLHLFDTFTGIPFEAPGDSNRKGEFGDTSAETVQAALPDANLHVGVFPDTLPAWLDDIAFVHCDCDQYASVRAVIDTLWPRMVPGAVMVFDDMNTTGGIRAITETFGKPHEFFGRSSVVKT